jgi:MraZ protein
LRYPILYGEYDLTLDDKNRILVPAEVRRNLDPELDGEAFFLIVGINRLPWLYPDKYYRVLATQTIPDITPGEDQLAFDQANFGLASRVEWDKQGRLVIPEKNLKRAALQRDLTLVGVRDHLELWNRKDWDVHRQELEGRFSDIALKAKQARQISPAAAPTSLPPTTHAG